MTTQTSGLNRAKVIGSMLRQARMSQDISLEDCAKSINIDPDKLDDFETGSSSPSLPELEGLAYYLDIPLEHFWNNRPLELDTQQKKQAEMERLMALNHIGLLNRKSEQDIYLLLTFKAE